MSIKVLIASDFHAREELKKSAVEEANNGDYDLFLYLGDFMDQEYAEELLDEVEVTSLATTGNRDIHFDQEMLEGSDVNIFEFLNADVDDEYTVILVGGEYTDQLASDLRDVLEQADPKTTIVGSHYPPEKLGDLIVGGDRIGRSEFRRMIMRFKPAVWACGHVHEDYGHFTLMDTDVLNASSHDTGKAFSLEIDEDGNKEISEVVLIDD